MSKSAHGWTWSYSYDDVGNLVREDGREGTTEYAYNAQNRLISGARNDGQSSEYAYNALGVRIANTQVRANENAGYASSDLIGYNGVDYSRFLRDGRDTSQRTWETEIGTTIQNDCETVVKRYVVDYLSIANRDIVVTEEGSWTQRYVYDSRGFRVSAEFDYAEGTRHGDAGSNFASDIGKIWYRSSHLGSSVVAEKDDGSVISHMTYDP